MTSTETGCQQATVEERLLGVGVSTIVLLLERLGFRGCFMTGVAAATPSARLAGRARTLRCLPARPDVVEWQRQKGLPSPHKQAFDGLAPGEVLVIDARGNREAAVMGDLFVERIKAAGGVGVVTDGCVRDVAEVAKVGIPVYAGGVHAATLGNRHVSMDVDLPVACGGVLVMPGDYVVGDSEGVVVVPAQLVEKVLDGVRPQEELDAFIREKLQEGLPLSRAYPPDEGLQPEYRSWLEKRHREGV